MMPLQEYFDFLMLLKNSTFVMTDGGSIQEECYCLGIPCLLLRLKTERSEGIGQNVCISQLDAKMIGIFLNEYVGRQMEQVSLQESEFEQISSYSPSKIIVDVLVDLNIQK